MTDTKLSQLSDWLRASHMAVAFTGAGISTESGIPDFRSPGGLWTKFKPIQFQDFVASESVRREAWRRKFELEKTFGKAKPNSGHQALSRLVAQKNLSMIITQNIDNLHQDAGVPAEQVVELHGNGSYALCLQCKARYSLAQIRKQFDTSNHAPTCKTCGGMVKTGTISFGQPMPEAEMQRAEVASLGCDLFLAIGSSLQVYPAAGFPILAKRNGAQLVIINREPTELDTLADITIHAEIGETLQSLINIFAS